MDTITFQQYRIVPSGCMHRRGFGNLHIVGANAKNTLFSFCSTLAVYIYQADTIRLYRLLSTKDNLMGMAWFPLVCHSHYLAAVSMEGRLTLWHVDNEEIVFEAWLPTKKPPTSLEWSPHETSILKLAIACADKNIYVWSIDLESGSQDVKFLLNKSTEAAITVIRWNAQQKGMLAMGFENGSIGIHTAKEKNPFIITRDKKSKKMDLAITDMQWDTLSNIYLLVAYKDGHCALWEVTETSGNQLHTFDKQGSGTNAISWLPSAPGQFVTANARSGILKVWNVSQPQPLQHIRVRSSGIHSIALLNGQQLICAAVDGSVGVFHMIKQQLEWSSNPGHKETIFDVRYQPSDPNILATCSHDSSVRIWSVDTMECLHHLIGQEGVLYSLAWSPKQNYLIASASSLGSVYIWDIVQSTPIVQMKHHTDAIYRIAWNSKGLIAASSKDRSVTISNEKGELIKRYSLPGAAFGCDWCPCNDGVLAVGCMDNVVRVFSTHMPILTPIRILSAHQARVFHAVWYADSNQCLLATSSDDNTVRVWTWPATLEAEDAVIPYITLTGHSNFVRALVWHAAAQPLLLSGSWDATIRIWDVNARVCKLVVTDHLADVYGIACHPRSPLKFVSCSRDTTIRFWSLRSNPTSLKWLKVILTSTDLDQLEDACVAAGTISGIENMFALLKKSSTKEMLIQREDTVVENYLEQARRLYSGQVKTRRQSKTTRLNKEEHIIQAAYTYLKAGAIERYISCSNKLSNCRYCELMIEADHWAEALSVAPGVSFSYWQSLAGKYAEHLATKQSEQAIPYYLAAQNFESAIEMYRNRGQFEDAFVIAKAYPGAKTLQTQLEPPSHENDSRKHLYSSRASLAAKYIQDGEPVIAACCHLSVNQTEDAISSLIQGDQLELAYIVSIIYSKVDTSLVKRLCFKYECLGAFDMVLELLTLLNPLEEKYSVNSYSHAQSNFTIPLKVPLPEKDQLEIMLQQALTEEKHVDAVRMYLFLKDEIKGATLALNEISEHLSAPSINWNAILSFASVLGSYNVAPLPFKLRAKLLATMAYVGAFQAIDLRYSCHGANIEFPISEPQLLIQEGEYVQYRNSEKLKEVLARLEKTRSSWSLDLQSKIKDLQSNWTSPTETFEVVVPGSKLPSAGQSKYPMRSLFTGEIIHGPLVKLEDDVSAISLEDAIMWSRVNPFSPLSTGERIKVYL
ncbi:WD repeat-containing protein 17 isoform X3 [Thraustotheca clavata]|uniref:WD repeat-containing protein 17 isoform X3 n=1 Tax=Thraustotheca clavata TaxID=74557 RepID=A0A1V9Y771_9STRA|nr:WD repeat-containing protein 17 isoform X3 [Thraustotheca clavata]